MALLLVFGVVGCGSKDKQETQTLKVSATLDPHSKILEAAKPILKEKYNIDLKVQVLDDYFIFNKSLDACTLSSLTLCKLSLMLFKEPSAVFNAFCIS